MMSMFRRICVLSAALLIVAGAGCSSEVRVGAVISETGSLSSYGEKVKKGLDLAVEELNAAGGIRGGAVSIIYKDDATNEDRGRQVALELIEQEDIRIIIGAISSPVTLAVAPICEEKEVILFSPSSSAPGISQAGEYIYRNYPSDILEGTSMAKFARDLGLERLAIFALDNEFGAGLKTVFTAQYESKYREVVMACDFEDGKTDKYAEEIDEIRALDPDGIYIVSYVNDMAEILTLLDGEGIDTVLMGSGSVTDDLIRLAGPAAENLVYPQPSFDVESRNPAVATFVDSYRAKYDEKPDIYAAHGYDALKLLAVAIESGGSSHPDDIRIGFSSIKNYEGAAGRTAFDENGDVVRYPRMFIIRNGASMPYETFVEEGGSLLTGR
jgi:branched-chain amino acid transport system substrate-binding protein